MLKPPFDELPNITKAVELYKNGDSLLKIACFIGATQKQVRKALIFSGVEIRRREAGLKIMKDSEKLKDVIESYRNGSTSMEIAERYKVSYKTILSVLRLNNVVIRPGGGNQRLSSSKVYEILLQYAEGHTLSSLSRGHKVDRATIRHHVKKWDVRVGFPVPIAVFRSGIPKKKGVSISGSSGKYDHLLFEPINQGHDYKDIVKKQTSLKREVGRW